MSGTAEEAAAVAALDRAALAADAAALVRVPSVTGDEREVIELLAAIARARGLDAAVDEHDLTALRAHDDHPGEEAPREQLFGVRATMPGVGAGPRLAIDGHLDVVAPGHDAWTHGGAWSGVVDDGFLYGRGSVDMKGSVAAALHALAAIATVGVVPPCTPTLLGVASEEDGGLGTFAALAADAGYDACLIPEATGFDVVCAQAGAITFRGVVRGRSAHAAHRLEGVSAIDRYLPIHAALHEYETRVNETVTQPLMAGLELPYPVLVGQVHAGEWSSQVPDRLLFEGRAPVRVGETIAEARAAVEAAIASATDTEGPAVEVTWSGGSFASAVTDAEGPFPLLVREVVGDEMGTPPALAGVPWGADMRLFCARGIPTVMVGPHGIERAHAADERVAVEDLEALARIIIRVVLRFRP